MHISFYLCGMVECLLLSCDVWFELSFVIYVAFVTFPYLSTSQDCDQDSLVPRLSYMVREKSAWYALFVHVQFPRDFEISIKSALLH